MLLSGTIFSFISTSPNHIFLHKILKCYTDSFLSRPIYSYPSTVNLMYHYIKVLLLRNYFYHHKSEVLWKKVWTKVNLVKAVTHLAMRCLYWGLGVGVLGGIGKGLEKRGTSDQKSSWPKGWPNIKLTQSSGHYMPLPGAGDDGVWWGKGVMGAYGVGYI